MLIFGFRLKQYLDLDPKDVMIPTGDNDYDCPCSMYRCCENPKLFTPGHFKCVDVCEGCFTLECENCGKWCCCDL